MLDFYSKIFDFKASFLMFAYFDCGQYSFTVVTVIHAMNYVDKSITQLQILYRAQTFFVFYCNHFGLSEIKLASICNIVCSK